MPIIYDNHPGWSFHFHIDNIEGHDVRNIQKRRRFDSMNVRRTEDMRIAVTAELNLTQLTTANIIRKQGTPMENIRKAVRQFFSNLYI